MDYRCIRRMAKMYREWYPDVTIRRAIHEALISYELYKETEVEIMDEHYSRYT
jgi:hypothetical protein